jgi:hypothetical protein
MKDTLGLAKHREPVRAILAQQVRGPTRAALIDLIYQKRAGNRSCRRSGLAARTLST